MTKKSTSNGVTNGHANGRANGTANGSSCVFFSSGGDIILTFFPLATRKTEPLGLWGAVIMSICTRAYLYTQTLHLALIIDACWIFLMKDFTGGFFVSYQAHKMSEDQALDCEWVRTWSRCMRTLMVIMTGVVSETSKTHVFIILNILVCKNFYMVLRRKVRSKDSLLNPTLIKNITGSKAFIMVIRDYSTPFSSE